MSRNCGKIVAIGLLIALLFPVQGVAAATYQDVQETIDGGVRWLAEQQNPDGSWGPSWGEGGEVSTSQVAKTGYAIIKLMDRSREIGEPDPMAGMYGTQIQDGLNFIFSKVQECPPDPDCVCDSGSIWDSPDGIQCYDLSEGYPNIVYETSIAVMAITNNRTPGTVVLDPNSPAFGMTYRQVVQNAVNYLESAQITKDLDWVQSGYGGWSYFDEDPWIPMPIDPPEPADQVNSGYAVLALSYARDPRNGFNIGIADESFQNLTHWVELIQDSESGGANSCILIPDYMCEYPWMNNLQTGYLLIQQNYSGYAPDNEGVTKAITYIANNWNHDPSDPSNPQYDGWRGNVRAMYTTTAGLQAFEKGTIPVNGVSRDWFADFEEAIVASRVPEETDKFYWEPDYWTSGDPLLSTELTLLTLEGWVYPAQTEMDVQVSGPGSPGGTVTCTVVVNNTGQSAVYDLDITESSSTGTTFGLANSEPVKEGGDQDNILEPGETWTYTAEASIPETLTDTITASGEDIRGRPVEVTEVEEITVAQQAERVSVDIKPGSCPNAFNREEGGLVPIALTGKTDLDVSQIDPASVTVEGIKPVRWAYEDSATPYPGDLCGCHKLKHDGIQDITFLFDQKQISGIPSVRDTEKGKTTALALRGSFMDGTAFEGADCILVSR